MSDSAYPRTDAPSEPHPAASLRWLVITALLLVVIFLILVAVQPAGYFYTIDEGGKYLYLQDVISQRNPAASLSYPGRALDPDLQFVPLTYKLIKDGLVHTWWTVGFPLLSLPFFQAFGWFGLFLLPVLSGALTALLAALIVRLLLPQSRWLPLAAELIVGLATPVLFYSTRFWEHNLAVAGLMGSIFFVLLAEKRNHASFLWLAGVCASYAVFMRTETAFLLFGVGLVVLVTNWRSGLRYGAAFVLFSLPWLAMNWLVMGNPINNQFSALANQPTFGAGAALGKRLLPSILFNPTAVWTLEFSRNLLIFGSLMVILAVVSPFFRRLRGVSVVGYAGLCGLCIGALFSSYGYRSLHGLLLAAPHVIFGIWLFVSGHWKKARLFSLSLVAGSLIFAAAYLYKAWAGAGGLQWGPRYLLAFYPLLVIASLVGLFHIWPDTSQWLRIGLLASYALSIVVGFGFEVRGQLMTSELLTDYQQTRPALEQLQDKPVVTYYCDIGMLIPDLYPQTQFFSTTWNGPDAFREHARRIGIPSYYQISIDACTPSSLDEIRRGRETNPTGLTVDQITP